MNKVDHTFFKAMCLEAIELGMSLLTSTYDDEQGSFNSYLDKIENYHRVINIILSTEKNRIIINNDNQLLLTKVEKIHEEICQLLENFKSKTSQAIKATYKNHLAISSYNSRGKYSEQFDDF